MDTKILTFALALPDSENHPFVLLLVGYFPES
jgi:hypothetical protein